MPRLRYELAARIIAEAEFSPDKLVCDRYGITPRTLQRYRVQMAEDPKLSDCVASQKEALESEWVSDAIRTMRCQFRFLRKAAQQADAKDPAAIHAIAGAMKLLGDGVAGSRIIDARLGLLGGPPDGDANRRALPPVGASPDGSDDDQDPPPDAD